MRTRSVWITRLLMFVLLASFVTPALANDADIRISLKGSDSFSAAKGSAKYRDRGGEREFQVEVENIRKLAGSTLSVVVDGSKVGSMKVNSFGVARLNLNTDRGQAVPRIHSGSTVKVRTAAGTLVVSGMFP